MAVRADDVDLERDAALVERFQTGDEAAFVDLYERYFNRLRRYCLRRLRDPHDAEEATQEALLRAYRALPRLDGDRRFYPWLRVIASNLCNDMRRRSPQVPLAEPEAGDAVVESLFDVLDREQVRAVLEGLAPRHQTALSLWAEGYPTLHIAAELGCTRGAADVTLHRARQSFRRRFLALNDDSRSGAIGGLGLVSSVVRWGQRMRVRAASRLGEHPELTSPLVSKLAAGVIAFGVVGGSLGAAGATSSTRPGAAPPAVTSHPAPVGATPGASLPVPSSTTARSSAATAASGAAATAASRPAGTSSPGKMVGPVLLTSNEDADRRGKDSPIRVEVAGIRVTSDPMSVVDGANRRLNHLEGTQ